MCFVAHVACHLLFQKDVVGSVGIIRQRDFLSLYYYLFRNETGIFIIGRDLYLIFCRQCIACHCQSFFTVVFDINIQITVVVIIIRSVDACVVQCFNGGNVLDLISVNAGLCELCQVDINRQVLLLFYA